MSADAPEDPLASIIDAILDGRRAEWPDAAHTESLSPEEQRALEPLRVLAAIASVQSPLGLSSLQDQGRFELGERIGQGASGEVFRARDLRLDREVALKIVPLDRPFAGSVLAEARRLARVRHPNVVTIYDVYETPLEGRICMELLSGLTLAQTLSAQPSLPVDDVLHIGRCLARALGAVHAAGLVHGDVKPNNVVVEESGRVVLMDFGAGTDLTRGKGLVRAGTPRYMAPEVKAGKPPGPESDIFSLGMLLLQLLTGRQANRDKGRTSSAPAESVRPALEHLPAPLSRVIRRALDPDPVARFGSAAELEAALIPPVNTGRQVILASLVIGVAGLCGIAWSARQNGTAAHQGIVERQLPMPPGTSAGDLLADGSVMAFTTRDRGVGVLDTRTGDSRILVMGTPEERVMEGVLIRSRDRMALFGWFVAGCDCVELRTVPVDGGAVRPLLRTPFAHLQLYSLSADGRSVLLLSRAAGAENRLVVADLLRGTATTPVLRLRDPAGAFRVTAVRGRADRNAR
jgi:hypothetical protein